MSASSVSESAEPGAGVDFADRDGLADRVADDASLAGAPAEERVLRVLEPGEALPFGADRTENLRGKRPARVHAPHHGRAGDARDLQREHFTHLRFGERAREVHEAGPPREVVEHRRLRTAEQRREPFSDSERIAQQIRIRGDVLRGLRDGEGDAVAVGYRSAFRGHGLFGHLLGARGLAQRAAAKAREIQRTRGGDEQEQQEGREDQADPPLGDRHGD
jgi:hypothetical protein